MEKNKMFARSDAEPSNPGDKYHVNYRTRLKADGSLEFYEFDKTDIQAEINAAAAGTDMSYIVNRLLNGDMSVFSDKAPLYGDFTEMPKNMMDAVNLHNDAVHAFDRMPYEVRIKYDNDVNKWLSAAGSPDWLNLMFPDNNLSQTASDSPTDTSPSGGDS
ncbi:minor capsid protein [Capybara microvirus Cap1_SP_131]|nr:minor capsid protein [Capybara microvirus Cap1_SP_131]